MVEEEREVLEDVGRTPESKGVEDLMREDLDAPTSDRFVLTGSTLTSGRESSSLNSL